MFYSCILLPEEDLIYVYFEETLAADEVEAFFDKSVEEIMNDDENLGKLVEFMMSYCFHAAPREKTLKETRQLQIDTFREDKTQEIGNDFKSLIEHNTLSDNAWTTWQYVNSYMDWKKKKSELGDKKSKAKHTLNSKFTSNGTSRFQPKSGSEGMLLYEKMSNWYAQFMRHPEFKGKVCKLSNKIAKTHHLLPTFSEEFGPRQSRPVDDDSEGEEAAEIDVQDINMPSLSFAELNSADSDYVDQDKGYDFAPGGTGRSEDEEQDENMSPSIGMEFD